MPKEAANPSYRQAAYDLAARTIRETPVHVMNGYRYHNFIRPWKSEIYPEFLGEKTTNPPRTAYRRALDTIPEFYPRQVVFSEYNSGIYFPLNPANPYLNEYFSRTKDSQDYRERFQYLVCELARGNIRIAIEGPRGSGKDTVVEALSARLQELGKIPVPSKLSGFIKSDEEKDKYLAALTPEQKTRFSSRFALQSIREGGNPMQYLTEYIDAFIGDYQTRTDSLPDDNSIIGAARRLVDEVAKSYVSPGYKGETSWHLLQDIFLTLLNDFWENDPERRKRVIHVSNGGHINRNYMYHRYNSKEQWDSPFAVNLLQFVPGPVFWDMDSLSLEEDQVSVPLPMPNVTYYLQAPEEIIRERIKKDGNRHPDGVKDRLEAMQHKPYLDKLALAYRKRHPYVVTIIDAGRSVEEIADTIIADMESRGVI